MNIYTQFALLKSSDVPNIPTGSADNLLYGGLNLAYFIAGIVAVIVIIISAITLVTNNGEPEALKTARNSILYAVVGLVVILAAFAVTWFIMGRIQ